MLKTIEFKGGNYLHWAQVHGVVALLCGDMHLGYVRIPAQQQRNQGNPFV
jgi:hypothetical protein